MVETHLSHGRYISSKTHSRAIAILFVLMLIIAGFSGCGGRSLRKRLEPEAIFHTVQYPGETLGIISAWYTGTPKNWKTLRERNGDLDYKRLQIGDEVYIPRQLIKRRRPLSPVFVASLSNKDAKRSRGAPKAPAATAEHSPVQVEPVVQDPPPLSPEEELQAEEQQEILAETRDELLRSLLESDAGS